MSLIKISKEINTYNLFTNQLLDLITIFIITIYYFIIQFSALILLLYGLNSVSMFYITRIYRRISFSKSNFLSPTNHYSSQRRFFTLFWFPIKTTHSLCLIWAPWHFIFWISSNRSQMSVTGAKNYKIFIFVVINENIPFNSGIIHLYILHTVRRQLYCLSSYFSYWFESTVSLPGRRLSQRVPSLQFLLLKRDSQTIYHFHINHIDIGNRLLESWSCVTTAPGATLSGLPEAVVWRVLLFKTHMTVSFLQKALLL